MEKNNRVVIAFIPLAIFVFLIVLFWFGLSINPRHMPSTLLNQASPPFHLKSLEKKQSVHFESRLKRPCVFSECLGDLVWCVSA